MENPLNFVQENGRTKVKRGRRIKNSWEKKREKENKKLSMLTTANITTPQGGSDNWHHYFNTPNTKTKTKQWLRGPTEEKL